MSISWRHVGSLQEPTLGISKECLEYPKGTGNRMDGVGLGRPTLGQERWRGSELGARLPRGLQEIGGNTSRANG
ncbi:UNVERIFIED_CONTAM: hypothetical protein Sradi_4044100 [Sesamum radiatum]|uniref:Uncharacterized protein n=1 Tax=Sesamum radiatum TaxID=300843 RepID=A0AAW2PJB5_SESRA